MWDGWSLQRTARVVKVHKVIGDKKVFVFKGFNESEDKGIKQCSWICRRRWHIY